MEIGRFLGGIAAVIRSAPEGKYLLLRRVRERDYAGGAWECVTGRVNQGESLTEAMHREAIEELGVDIEIDFLLGTVHFYRGAPTPENELLGVVACCSLPAGAAIRLDAEHDAFCWVTPQEAEATLSATDPSTEWIRGVIARAEEVRRLVPPELIALNHAAGFEMG